MDFPAMHAEYMRYHASRLRGEELRRLMAGHGHAEKLFLEAVWLPAFNHFHHLYPEYPVEDFRGGQRFLDFAYLRPPVRLAIEIDGYKAHADGGRISRDHFTDDRFRQDYLVIDGWFVLRFSYDAIEHQPRLCQQILQQFMGRWVNNQSTFGLSVRERAVVRLAQTAGQPVTPGDVAELLGVSTLTARKVLLGLTQQGWLEPARGQQRIRAYQVGARRLVKGGKGITQA